MEIEAIKTAYRRYAPIYDFYFGAVLHNGRKRVVEKMNCRPGDHILEVGVGTGLSLALYDRSVTITGIDISTEMLQKARRLKERESLRNVVALEEMDAENLTFADDAFDKVTAMYVASVVRDPVQLVDEMRRVCKPNGELFIVNHFQRTESVIGGIERLIAPLSRILGWHPDFPLDPFVTRTRLDIIERIPVNFFGYWTMLKARNNKG